MAEVELFSHDWSGWPVIESPHVYEQVESRVAEQYLVSPSSKFGLVCVFGSCHGSTLYMPCAQRCKRANVILNLVKINNVGEYEAGEVLSGRFLAYYLRPSMPYLSGRC